MTKEEFNKICSEHVKNDNMTEYMKDNPVQKCFNKLDGSLILVGIIDNKLIAKSKTSLFSDQAYMANRFLDAHTEYRNFCEEMIAKGKTPVFEGIGSENIIVIRYTVDFELVLLGVVDNTTGEVETFEELPEYPNIKIAEVYYKDWDELLEIKENSQENIEGFVVKSDKGLCKVKTLKYIDLHSLKDSINSEKALASLILDDNIDDLIGSFRDDEVTVNYIIQKQEEISKVYNTLVKSVEDTYKKTKNLERKDFAIHNRNEFPGLFGLLMSKYLGKEVNYKDFFMKNKMYE